jgi:hypothetical protein
MIRKKYFFVYLIAVVICLLAIAIGINNKAYKAVAPPIYDPIGYYAKSHSVWDSINKRKALEVFTTIPSRPPGTALILYPFGFVPSIQSFLFRSTFAPVCIWALALMVIILPNIRNLKDMLVGTALTAGLLALPIFYHFEFPIDPKRSFSISIQWGLVDVLQASMAALALGLLYTGVKKNLNSLVVLAWVVGAYTLFIKPSGILVLGSLFPIYFTEGMILWRQAAPPKKKFLIRHLALFGVGIGITVASIWLAFSSGYLSKEVIETAKIGQKVLIQISNQSLWTQMDVLWKPVIGHWWIPVIAVTLLISIGSLMSSLFRLGISDLGLRFVSSLLVFSSALYWWMTMAGQEHRYLFPFIMLIMSWLIVPTLFEWMISLGSRVRYMAIAYCLVPLICIITLLNIQQGKVSSGIERFFGFNLDTGQYSGEVKIGRSLLQEALKSDRQITIYSIGNFRVGAVEMIDWVNSIENPLEPHHFNTYRVNDWIHPGIKMKQLLSCDYFIIEKSYLDQVPSAQNDAKRWQDEESFLVNFIKSFTQQNNSAIRLIQDGPVSLYKVQNREKYVAACNDWVANHKWSDDFWGRNSYDRGDFEMPGLKVINPKVVDDLLSKTTSVLPVIDFGHKLTLLALLRNTNNYSVKSSGDLITFLFRADQEIPIKYAIFIHLMDKDKKVIFQHDFQIDPDGGIISQGTLWKSVVQIPENELSQTFFIGFGAYIPSKEEAFLQSNYKQSDWNGNRVILNLKP